MTPDLHPIQVRFVAVRELFLQTFWPPSPDQDPSGGEVEISNTMGEFDTVAKTVQVGLIVKMGIDHDPSEEEIAQMKEARKPPFRLRVHLIAEFAVDTSQFPVEKIEKWALVNAPLTLMPFLREHVYSLTARAGYKPVILPMVIVPTFRIERPQVEQAEFGTLKA